MSLDLDAWGDEFVARCKPYVRDALLAAVGEVAPEEIAALGLYTDADASSVVAGACTKQHLERQRAQRPQYPQYFLWSTGEWDLSSDDAGGPDPLGPVSEEMARVGDRVEEGEAGDDGFGDYRLMAWSCLVDAMAELFDEGFFDAYVDAVQVFEALDAGVDQDTQRVWMAAINTDEASARFDAYLADPAS